MPRTLRTADLQRRAAGQPRDRLDDGGQRQQPGDVVEPQLAAGEQSPGPPAARRRRPAPRAASPCTVGQAPGAAGSSSVVQAPGTAENAQPPAGVTHAALAVSSQRAASAPVVSTSAASPEDRSTGDGSGAPAGGKVERVHGQLVGGGRDQGRQRQRTEHRADGAGAEATYLVALEEGGDLGARLAQRGEHVGPGRAGPRLEDRLVVRRLVERAGPRVGLRSRSSSIGLVPHPLERPAARPRPEVDADVASGPAAHPAGGVEVDRGRDLGELVPRGQHQRREVRGLPGRQPALVGGGRDGRRGVWLTHCHPASDRVIRGGRARMPLSVGGTRPRTSTSRTSTASRCASRTCAGARRPSSSSTPGPSPGSAAASCTRCRRTWTQLVTDDVELVADLHRLDVRPARLRRPGGLHLPDALGLLAARGGRAGVRGAARRTSASRCAGPSSSTATAWSAGRSSTASRTPGTSRTTSGPSRPSRLSSPRAHSSAG